MQLLISTLVQKLKKQRWTILILVIFSLCYFLIRLFHIMDLPIFTDEGIYVRWSQIARYDAAWRFISLTDGKQPSFVWASMILMRFVEDPLFAGRLVSVLAGFLTMIGLFFLSREIFKNTRIGILTSFLYLIYPMALVYDRMALYDSFVGMCMVWALYLEVLLVRRLRLDIALILGMVIGVGMLTKTNAFFSIPFLLVILLLFDWKDKNWQVNLLKFVSLAGVATVIGVACYTILRLSPFFHIIAEKNSIFVYPIHDWLQHPFEFFVGNLRGLFDWLTIYLSYPLFLMVFLSFFLFQEKSKFLSSLRIFIPAFFIGGITVVLLGIFGDKDSIPEALPFFALFLLIVSIVLAYRQKVPFLFEKIVLIMWFGIPFIYLAFFGKTIYPRFIFFMTLALLPLISYTLIYLYEVYKKSVLIVLLGALLFILPLRASYLILTDIARSPIPFADLEQYINGWPAGGGVRDIIGYLKEQAKHQKIYVLSTGTFGSLSTNATEIYLGDNKNVEKEGLYPVPNQLPQKYLDKARTMPVYVFFSNQEEHERNLPNWPLTLLFTYNKGIGTAESRLYQVNLQ